MGWDFGWSTAKALRAALNAERSSLKLLAQRSANHGAHLWSVYEDAAGRRFIHLDLIRRSRGTFGYKGINESAGPFEADCPLAFLELAPDPQLSDLHREWSDAFRQRVRDYWTKKAK